MTFGLNKPILNQATVFREVHPRAGAKTAGPVRKDEMGEPAGASNPRRPEWLKVRLPQGDEFARTNGIVAGHRLHTVCQSANCPNVGECWSAGTATFMILGNVCTRSCGFCAVLTGRPPILDQEEPERVALAIAQMNLVHAVITSVNRDELSDGGASIWAATIRAIRRHGPSTRIEVLIPDLVGAPLDMVLDAAPDIVGHNVETIPRLYRKVRPQARYERSLKVLAQAKGRGFVTKSSIMLGLGETESEVFAVMRDLIEVGCDIFTIGQYLQPTRSHLPVQRYAHPSEFARLAEAGRALGFLHVESGPLVRSSYHAERAARALHLGETGPAGYPTPKPDSE
jgi:lipoic acid synthetase